MKTRFLLLVLIGSTITASAQSPKRVNRFPVGTFHRQNQNIYGITVGLYSGVDDEGEEDRNVHTNGIRLEPVGLGLLIPFIPDTPISENETQFRKMMDTPPSERVNGLNLSPAGTIFDGMVNGISAGIIGQMNRSVTGISASLMINFTERHNGIQMAAFTDSYKMNGIQIGASNYGRKARGLQIGLFNKSDDLKGLQIGLWNINQKRKFPIINWNFRK